LPRLVDGVCTACFDGVGTDRVLATGTLAARRYHARSGAAPEDIRLSKLPKPNALIWLLLSAAVIALDQVTKALVRDFLVPYLPHVVIPRLINWTLAYNRGAAFSFLAGSSGWQVWLFGALAVAVSIGLIVWLARTARRDWRTALPVALIIGGALGNLIDRLMHGRVTDFIQVYWQTWYFPAFNVADSAITVGAVLLIFFGLFAGKREG
jgi:signal peptidase II